MSTIPKGEMPSTNPIEEQRKQALAHYQEASSAISHWSGFVENAIKSYQLATDGREELEKENAELKRDYSRLTSLFENCNKRLSMFVEFEKIVVDADLLALRFATWLKSEEGQMYEATGMSAYDLLDKYKDRPYIDMNTNNQ